MVKPKRKMLFRYGKLYRASIQLYPTQRWEYRVDDEDEDVIILSRKGVSFELARQDFKNSFEKV